MFRNLLTLQYFWNCAIPITIMVWILFGLTLRDIMRGKQ